MTGLDLKFTAVLTLFSSTLYSIIMCTSQSQVTETCSTEEMRRAAVNELQCNLDYPDPFVHGLIAAIPDK